MAGPRPNGGGLTFTLVHQRGVGHVPTLRQGGLSILGGNILFVISRFWRKWASRKHSLTSHQEMHHPTLSKFTTLFIFLPLLVILGCKSTIVQASDDSEPTILGSWFWVESWVKGFRHTPESSGNTRIYEFRSDSVLLLYVDDNLRSSAQYRITREIIDRYKDSVDIVYLLSFRNSWVKEWAAQYVGKDTLRLTGLGPDSGFSVYIRTSKK